MALRNSHAPETGKKALQFRSPPGVIQQISGPKKVNLMKKITSEDGDPLLSIEFQKSLDGKDHSDIQKLNYPEEPVATPPKDIVKTLRFCKKNTLHADLPLEIQSFWEVIENSFPAQDDRPSKFRILSKTLSAFSEESIVQFALILKEYTLLIDKPLLTAASGLIMDCAAEAQLASFREWLISKGRSVLEAAMADPDTLKPLISDTSLEMLHLFEDVYSAWSRTRKEAGLPSGRESFKGRTGINVPEPVSVSAAGEFKDETAAESDSGRKTPGNWNSVIKIIKTVFPETSQSNEALESASRICHEN
jgi:hypothetical protein